MLRIYEDYNSVTYLFVVLPDFKKRFRFLRNFNSVNRLNDCFNRLSFF